MTIIAIFIAFALCHFVRELGRCRNNAWLGKWVRFANDAFSGLPSWSSVTGFIVLMAVPLFGLLLVNEFLTSLLGSTGWFLLALAASVPFWYTAIQFYIWDRDLGFREDTLYYWIVVWGMWPAFGLIQGAYALWRLLG